jgi:diguanylate cyclase (GGDEF)-like protein
VAGRDLHISCSIGIAHFPGDGDNADDLINRADQAMYKAKGRGRAGWST